jgi:hypothetical protein
VLLERDAIETRKRDEREDRKRSDSGSPHFSSVGLQKEEMSWGKKGA